MKVLKTGTPSIPRIISKIASDQMLTTEEQSAIEDWCDRHGDNRDIYKNLTISAKEVFSPDFDKHYPTDFLFNRVMEIAARIQRRRKRTTGIISVFAFASCIILAAILYPRQTAIEPIESATTEGYILLTDNQGGVVNLEEKFSAESTDRGFTVDLKQEDISTNVSTMAEAKILTITVPKKKDLNIILPDGSKVWLNSESEISFPEYFDKNLREVLLNGEAYFDVAGDPSKPFIVKAGSLTTRVYGTQFFLTSYRGDDYHRVSLIEGSLGVAVGDGEDMLVLKPGEGVQYDKANDMCSLFKVNTSEAVAVSSGLFVFDKEPLAWIVSSLERWYGVGFIFEDPQMAEMKFYVRIDKYENIRNVLDHLKATHRIDYRFDGSTVTFVRP